MTEKTKKEVWEIIQACRDERPTIQNWDNYWDLPPFAVSFPIKGGSGKTGEWRTFRPVVDHTICIKCYFCYMYCPEGVISVDESTGQVSMDYEYCKGCGICANNCPKKCITMEKEEK